MVWLQVVVVVLLCAAAGWSSGDLPRTAGSSFHAFNVQRLDEYRARFEPLRPPVVILGSSVVKIGVPDWTEEPEAEPPVLRVVDHHAFFDDLEAVAAEVLAARPQVLVVQVRLVDAQPTWRMWLGRFRQRQAEWLTGSADEAFVQFGDVCPNVRDYGPSLAKTRRRLVRGQVARFLEWQEQMTRRDGDAAVPGRARDLVLRAAADGIRVVLLVVPQARDLERRYPVLTEALEAQVDALAAGSELIEVWRAPQLDDDAFCDPMHFNERGRRALSEWLQPRLQARLDDPG